jgi:hypothetical protein
MEEKIWEYNDGGRADAGFKGKAGDCVTRAIAIATGLPYKEVYDELGRRSKLRAESYRGKRKKFKNTARDGVHREIYEAYLEELGWTWTPTMQVGQGCKVHLRADELPEGTVIVRVSRHVVTVVDGVIQDNHNSSRGGNRCVYGYYTKN